LGLGGGDQAARDIGSPQEGEAAACAVARLAVRVAASEEKLAVPAILGLAEIESLQGAFVAAGGLFVRQHGDGSLARPCRVQSGALDIVPSRRVVVPGRGAQQVVRDL